MANWLQAIGQGGAVQAMTGSFRDMLQATEAVKNIPLRQQQREEEMAVSKESMLKMKEERAATEEKKKRDETPINIMSLNIPGLDPEIKNEFNQFALGKKYTDRFGNTTRAQAEKAFTEFIKEGDLAEKLNERQVIPARAARQKAEEMYAKELQTGGPKRQERYNELEKARAEEARWSKVAGDIDTAKKQIPLYEQIQSFKDSGQWDEFDSETQNRLDTAAKLGDPKEFQQALRPVKQGSEAAQQWKQVEDPNSNTGWSWQNMATGEMRSGAAVPSSEKPEKTTKPDYDIVHNKKTGEEKYITKGSPIPKGWTTSKPRTEGASIKDAMALRKQFDALPEVKEYKNIITKYNVMEKALAQSKKGGNLVGVDQALISLYNKMSDPQSVVRESEYARTAQNMPVINSLVGKMEKWKRGGAGLTQTEREALVSIAKEFRNTYQAQYEETAERYRGYAKQGGIDPEEVVPSPPTKSKDPAGIRPEKTSQLSPSQRSTMFAQATGQPVGGQRAVDYSDWSDEDLIMQLSVNQSNIGLAREAERRWGPNWRQKLGTSLTENVG